MIDDESDGASCNKCRFSLKGYGYDAYDCRRRAPSMVQVEAWQDIRQFVPKFPVMHGADWCGDFKAKMDPKSVETPEHLLLEQRAAQLAEENERLTIALENMSAEATLGVSAATMSERCRCIGACLSEQLQYRPETEAELAYTRAVGNCIEAIRADPKIERHDGLKE